MRPGSYCNDSIFVSDKFSSEENLMAKNRVIEIRVKVEKKECDDCRYFGSLNTVCMLFDRHLKTRYIEDIKADHSYSIALPCNQCKNAKEIKT